MAGRVAEGTGGLKGLDFERDGAVLLPGLAASFLDALAGLFREEGEAAGSRLSCFGEGQSYFTAPGVVGKAVATVLAEGARPVRAIAFDKSTTRNWALGWHQDRTICVKERVELDGFGPWTIKHGLNHVEPPFELVERMVTVRIHIDAVDADNAPLRIAIGSHRMGKLSEPTIADLVARSERLECHARPGDVWVYSTPILHSSERAKSGRRRRVLQVDYSADRLPTPLRWAFNS